MVQRVCLKNFKKHVKILEDIIANPENQPQARISAIVVLWERGNLTGQQFGRLTVTGRAANGSALARWECVCDCGGSSVAYGHHLRGGRKKSCGCYCRENQLQFAAIARLRQKASPELARERARARYAENLAENRKKALVYSRKWRAANPEKYRASIIRALHRYREKRLGA